MTESTDLQKDPTKLKKDELVEVAKTLNIPTAGATKDELVEAIEDRVEDGPGHRGIRGDKPQYLYPGE